MRKANDLAQWLFAVREYVYEEPSGRIEILAKIRSSAWRLPESDGEREEWFNCLVTEGYYFLYNGNILRSIDAYEKAYKFYNDHPLPGADLLEYVMKPLGNNYTRLGDYGRATYIQEKSLELANKTDTTQKASICHNLATTAIWKGDPELAKQYCEMGLSKADPHSTLYGLLLSTLAGVELKMGETQKAERHAAEAVRILRTFLGNKEESQAPYWLQGAYKESGNIAMTKKDHARALMFYKKADELIATHYRPERVRERAQLAVLSGQALLEMQQLQQALEAFERAITYLFPVIRKEGTWRLPAINELHGENALLDALNGRASALDKLGRKIEALESYRLMYPAERKLRHEFFSDAALQQHRREIRAWEEASIKTAYDLWKLSGKKEFAESALLFAELSKGQLLLDELENNLRYNGIRNKDSILIRQEQLNRAIALYERESALSGKSDDSSLTARLSDLRYELSLVQKQVRVKPPLTGKLFMAEELLSADSLLAHIPENGTLIEFFCGEKHVYVIGAKKGKVTDIRQLDNAPALLKEAGDFVNNWFQQGPAKMTNNPAEYHKEAYRLYQALFSGMKINGEGELILVPDGILGFLPFDALITDSVYRTDIGQWPFLVRSADLHLSYSLQAAIRQEEFGNRNGSFAGFFVAFDSSTQASIPAVKKEADAIRKIMKGNFYEDSDASLTTFREQLGKVNLLHVSTHSFLQGRENMPVLELADDKFFLFELAGNHFQPQLVVLSACRTGHGMLAQGEGIISLARGFTASGAGGIIAGLWDMNDEVTASLMENFYRELLVESRPAEALHKAKLQWLNHKRTTQLQKLPYYWAGMVYSGGNGKIELEKQHSTLPPKWLYAMFALLAAAIGIFYLRMKKKTA